MKNLPRKFADKWAVESISAPGRGPESIASLAVVERALSFTLPTAYVQFMLSVGGVWTPHILSSVVENETDLPDLRKISSFEGALAHTKTWHEIMLPEDLFAFATDAMGNMFCFRISQCTSPRRKDLPVHFFDHDEETTEQIADSFEGLLVAYLGLPKPTR